MPAKPLRPCPTRGCRNYIRGGSHCQDCKRRQDQRYNAKRPDAEIFYKHAPWLKLRRMQLRSEPLCRTCKAAGRITPAELVDHIIPFKERPDLALDQSNLRSLCSSCHARVGARAYGQATDG